MILIVKKSVRYSRVLLLTKLVVSEIQCEGRRISLFSVNVLSFLLLYMHANPKMLDLKNIEQNCQKINHKKKICTDKMRKLPVISPKKGVTVHYLEMNC